MFLYFLLHRNKETTILPVWMGWEVCDGLEDIFAFIKQGFSWRFHRGEEEDCRYAAKLGKSGEITAVLQHCSKAIQRCERRMPETALAPGGICYRRWISAGRRQHNTYRLEICITIHMLISDHCRRHLDPLLDRSIRWARRGKILLGLLRDKINVGSGVTLGQGGTKQPPRGRGLRGSFIKSHEWPKLQ